MNKVKLALLSTAAVAVVASGAGATFALFTASAGPSGTDMQAGTVELALLDNHDGSAISSPYFSLSEMAPGDKQTKEVWVKNDGTLDFRYQLDLAKTADGGELDDALILKIERWNGSAWVNWVGSVAFNTAAAPGALPNPGISLASGGQHGYRVTFELPTSTGNAAQGDSVEFNFTVSAEQTKNNP